MLKIIIHADPDLEDIIPRYLEGKQKDIQSIRDFLERRDFESIHVLGHGMKGSGGGFGFDAITNFGDGLEHAARDSNISEIEKLLDELLDYLQRVEVVYD
jgi:HPt (histidine-containing phosphotransfer) domain-containing protein